MTDLVTTNLAEEFGDAAPFLQPAAEAVAEAETTIATKVWLAGQALEMLHRNCKHGQWGRACEAIGVDPDRALRYRHVFERWPSIESLPDLKRELLITLAAPSVPGSARERVIEMAANGDAPSVREAASIVDEERMKPSTPTEFDHDVDRTRQEPEDGELTPKEARRLLLAIRRSAQSAKDKGVPWRAIQSMLQGLADETGDALVGIDDNTIAGMLR